jgi:hypothetical protein
MLASRQALSLLAQPSPAPAPASALRLLSSVPLAAAWFMVVLRDRIEAVTGLMAVAK